MDKKKAVMDLLSHVVSGSCSNYNTKEGIYNQIMCILNKEEKEEGMNLNKIKEVFTEKNESEKKLKAVCDHLNLEVKLVPEHYEVKEIPSAKNEVLVK